MELITNTVSSRAPNSCGVSDLISDLVRGKNEIVISLRYVLGEILKYFKNSRREANIYNQLTMSKTNKDAPIYNNGNQKTVTMCSTLYHAILL